MQLFSVIVTTLDFAPFVRATLDSLQTAIDTLSRQPGAPGVEVVVVDDGSSDDTPRLVAAFVEGRQNWRLLRREKPTSPSAARNFGAAHTSGDVLCFLDGDDLYLPGHLAACWRHLTDGFDFVKTSVRLADAVHPDWVARIEGSLVLNLAVRRRCHEALGGFPDWHVFQRDGDGFRAELDVFHKVEDQFYNRELGRRFRGVGVREQTVQYVRRPGNSFDRQLAKFRRPASEAKPPAEPRELLRLRLAELLAGGVPTEGADSTQPVVPDVVAGPAGLAESVSEAEGRRLAEQGVQLAQAGWLEEAIGLMRRAVQACPGDARSANNLGVALAQAGKPQEAAEHLREAARLDPAYAEAWYNLGNVLTDLRHKEEAEQSYRQALAARPDHFGALNNLGLLLQGSGRPGEAIILLRHACRLSPQSAEARNNLGLALADLGRFEQAEAAYHEALALKPGYADAHANLGCALKELGRTDEALACFGLALALEPSLRSARYNRALTLLQAGDWQKGWKDYESRWGRKSQPERPFAKPRWDGSDLEGRTVLAWCEQGLGDAIQFLRFAPLLKDRGARVVVECPPPLMGLFSSCQGIELAAEGQALPEFDVQVPLMSLPGLLGVTPDSVPGEPYLSAQPERVQRWREALVPSGLRVGIVWQGNPRFEWDRWRSCPLGEFAPLAEVEGVELVSLQKGPGEDQIDALRGRCGVRRLEGLDAEAPFLDTAAVMACLDLVVCVDTSAGHLAGAMGVPCWLALSTVSDWRWMRGREDTPWYPGHRLFRQRTAGDWGEVFARMAAELRRLAEGRRGGSVAVRTAPAEVVDRWTILRIKAERIRDEAKLVHVRRELEEMERAARALRWTEEVGRLSDELKGINERLWDVEDRLREHEAKEDFRDAFVGLARSVYQLNDRRGALKRRLNALLGATWSEQKQYGSAQD